jgi:hypothetical protein
MTIEYHPAGFDFRSRFSDVREVLAGEGEVCYAASDGADALLITDSGTLADLFGDGDLAAQAVSVRRFASSAERDAFVGARVARREEWLRRRLTDR